MQLESKIAIGVGAVVIGLGAWYATTRALQKPATSPPPVMADNTPAPPTPSADATHPPEAPRNRTHNPRPTNTVRNTELPRPAIMDAGHAQTRPAQAATEVIVAQAPTPREPNPEPTHEASGAPPSAPEPLAAVLPEPPAPAVATRPAVAPEPAPTPAEPPAVKTEEAASPPPPTPSTPAPTARTAQEHVIQPGDTFSDLAVHYYGNAKYVGLIQNANPDKDPRRLRPGQKIVIPPGPEPAAGAALVPSPAPVAAPVPAPSVAPKASNTAAASPASPTPASIPPGRAYTVKPRDTWETLAKRFLGKASDGPELYELNRERVKGGYPGNLRPGMVIELPERANMAAARGTTRPASP
jgi:nucleoid-associated protein YgaU